MSETAERPHRRPPGAPRNGPHLRRDSRSDRTAPEVDMGFDKLDDMLDKWADDIRKGT
jgi:hypothetical protein